MKTTVEIDLQGMAVEDVEKLITTKISADAKRSATYERKREEKEQYYRDHPEELEAIEAEREAKKQARLERERNMRAFIRNNPDQFAHILNR